MKYRIMDTESFGGSGAISRGKVLGALVLLIFGIGLMLAGRILTGLVLIGPATFILLIVLSEPEWKVSAIKARWALAGIGWLEAAGGFAFNRAGTKED